jgi:hypothetical protein
MAVERVMKDLFPDWRIAALLVVAGLLIGLALSPARYVTVNSGNAKLYVVDRLTGAIQYCSLRRCSAVERVERASYLPPSQGSRIALKPVFDAIANWWSPKTDPDGKICHGGVCYPQHDPSLGN